MAAGRRPDTIRVEIIGSSTVRSGSLDNFTSVMIRNDITMPSEASFELGDEGTWNSLGNVFEPGVVFQVFVDERPRMRGRVEMNDVPMDPDAGAVVRFTVRTKLSDAMMAGASQGVKVKGVSIEDFVLAVYEPLGYTKNDFEFTQGTSLNLMTGKNIVTGNTPVDLERIKVSEARVKPPETIYAAVDRHLRRHGFMHWDDPTGKIIVGAPNDEQDSIYTFNMFRSSRTQVNNTLSSTRSRDWSSVPSAVNVYGRGGKRGFTRTNVGATANDLDVTGAGFYRPVHILAEGIRTNELALRAAHRDLSARSKRKDSFNISTDGFAQWNGEDELIYAPDSVCTVNTDVAGGDAGPYYIHATTLTRNAQVGDTTSLEMVRRGIWRL